MICRGFHDVQTKHNTHLSLLGFLKITYSETMEDFLFTKYFAKIIKKDEELYPHKYSLKFHLKLKLKLPIKFALKILINRSQLSRIYEYILLDLSHSLLKTYGGETRKWNYYYYTLYHLSKYNVERVNRYVLEYCNRILEIFKPEINNVDLIIKAESYIERNKFLLKYLDILFTSIKSSFHNLQAATAKIGALYCTNWYRKNTFPYWSFRAIPRDFRLCSPSRRSSVGESCYSCEKKWRCIGCKDAGTTVFTISPQKST